MNLQDLAAIAEVVAGAAVIASLVYLALQIRQSNTATHRQMYMEAASTLSEYWLALAQDYPLYEKLTTMLRAPDELSNPEKEQAYLLFDSYMSLMESFYLHNQEYGENTSQERWGRILGRMLNAPGGTEYWLNRRFYFHGEFSIYVDSLFVKNEHEGSDTESSD